MIYLLVANIILSSVVILLVLFSIKGAIRWADVRERFRMDGEGALLGIIAAKQDKIMEMLSKEENNGK